MTKTEMTNRMLTKDADWWRGAVIYQIYPRSYQDSNADGIGDLGGIAERLPYIAKLGVDAIWISPFFTSPMKDFGYDVSNYVDVDPMFGSLADFDRVIETAHRFGVKVLIDLVLSHTSDQHPWFKESRSNRSNPKADWYVWAEPKPDGTPPNNWLAIFGGSAWSWDPRREQYYLHNFLASQPDLNHHCPAVQDALLEAAHFWLERGVDGFRLDTINFYMHDAQLRDNPALPKAERNASIAPEVNPYNHQRHLYDKNQPGNLEFLRRLRKVMNPYKAAAVGEIGDAQRGLELLGEYTSGGDKVQMSYAFEFLSDTQPTARRFAEVFAEFDRVVPEEGWACWAFSNHDVKRHATRWNLSPAAERTYATLIMCLRGSVCVYQGEELGLPEAEIPYELIQDPYGREFWPSFKGRDGCRTPMVWTKSNRHGGFSDAEQTWLPVDERHLPLAVSEQENDPRSLMTHYRNAIRLRHDHLALAQGTQSEVRATGEVLWFERRHGDERVLCAFNLSDNPSEFELPKGNWASIAAGIGGAEAPANTRIRLAAWQVLIALQSA